MKRLVLRAVTLSVFAFGLTAFAQQFTHSANLAGGSVAPLPPTPSILPAQTSDKPTADEIVERMIEKNKERLTALERYESDRTYRVEYKGTGGEHHAELRVHAEYVGPNQKKFTVISESGPKFLCEKVLRKLVESEQEASTAAGRNQITLSPETYTMELTGEETVAGERAWVLHVAPRVENKFSYRGDVWISQDDYGILRVVGSPAKSPSWWIDRASFDSRYVRRGNAWLPESNVATSHVRIGGQATLTIDYGT